MWMNETPDFSIVEKDYDWLKSYCIDQYSKIITPTSVYWERYALTCYDEFEMTYHIYSIILNNEDIGYAIVPKYMPEVLKSLFITPRFRRQGIGSKVTNMLKIEKLSCIADNQNALRVYQRLGFQTVITKDPNQGSLMLERKLCP
jgi:GNAT superfamily N-acetyltransferase